MNRTWNLALDRPPSVSKIPYTLLRRHQGPRSSGCEESVNFPSRWRSTCTTYRRARASSPKDRTDLRAQKCQKSLRKAEWNDGSCWSNHRLSKLHPPAILAMRKNKCYIWSRKYCAERVTFRPIGKTANPSLALHSCSAPPPPLIPSPPRMKFVPLRDARRPSLKPWSCPEASSPEKGFDDLQSTRNFFSWKKTDSLPLIHHNLSRSTNPETESFKSHLTD